MKNTVKAAASFKQAIADCSKNEVIALGVKGWVIVTKTHPLLNTSHIFSREQAREISEEQARAQSLQPKIAIV